MTYPQWDLSRLYAGFDDPAIASDLARAHAHAAELRDRHVGRVASLDAPGLRQALEDHEACRNQLGKLDTYAALRFATDTGCESAKALLARVQGALTETDNQLRFFELELQQLPDGAFVALVDAEALAPYRYHLAGVRVRARHALGEAEERLMAIKDRTGHQAWVQLYTEVTSRLQVAMTPGAPAVPVAEVRALRSGGDRPTRQAASLAIARAYAAQAPVLTTAFNAAYEDHIRSCALRQHADQMEPTLLDDDIAPEVVEALMDATERHYGLARRYYRVKARVLGLDDFSTDDTPAPLSGESRAIGYDEARAIVLDAFDSFSPAFGTAARSFFDGGYIDAAPSKTKQSGAFASGRYPGEHPYVFLSYGDRLHHVMLLAHELGHGVHYNLAREVQSYVNHYPSTPMAETASTFAEMLVLDRMLALETDPGVRRQLLADRIEDAIGIIMRQVMFTRWEQQARAARRSGIVPASELCRLWADGQRQLFGDAVRLAEGSEWGWMAIPHLIKYRYYCYSYAFGKLLVYALYARYQAEGEAFVPRFLALLAAGRSASPAELLAGMGVDIADPAFWDQGFTRLAAMLEAFEATVAPD